MGLTKNEGKEKNKKLEIDSRFHEQKRKKITEKRKKESEKEMQKRRNENKIMFDYIGETIIRNFIFITFMLSFFGEEYVM